MKKTFLQKILFPLLVLAVIGGLYLLAGRMESNEAGTGGTGTPAALQPAEASDTTSDGRLLSSFLQDMVNQGYLLRSEEDEEAGAYTVLREDFSVVGTLRLSFRGKRVDGATVNIPSNAAGAYEETLFSRLVMDVLTAIDPTETVPGTVRLRWSAMAEEAVRTGKKASDKSEKIDFILYFSTENGEKLLNAALQRD